jgi:predicted aldo/keto reductase-like oxidoreductase
MRRQNDRIGRRAFLRTVGAAGLGSILAGCKRKDEEGPNAVDDKSSREPQEAVHAQVPRRTLGKTGVQVSVLGLGTMFNLVDNQLILRNTLKQGVRYWDTANVYAGGNSELGIGKFLKNNPEARKEVFLVSKASRAETVAEYEERLQLSLQRLNTDYIDLYYAPHGASDPAQFTDELRQWVQSAKQRNLIRFFGFSTHANVAQCLAAAAKLDWIDVIMPMYNFRVMQDAEMQAAVEACHKANIGLVAMKTTGKTTLSRFRTDIETDADKKMVAHFLDRGFSPEQACIKFALDDERISCACVQMENTAVLEENVAAAMNKTKLARADREVLAEYARATCQSYCQGCAHICNSAVPDAPCVSDVMRFLMYYNSYGDRRRAREEFARIPSCLREGLLDADYTLAEARCPQRLPIGRLVAEAVEKLA